jgi:hypothetical protein
MKKGIELQKATDKNMFIKIIVWASEYSITIPKCRYYYLMKKNPKSAKHRFSC